MLSEARAFFFARNVMEVDVPLLSTRASIDAHIDLIPALYHHTTVCYMHSSPEYGMKRLLALGCGDIYQISHVFRDGELGRKHNPEFMMAEWYRVGFTFQQLIDETLDFIKLFLGSLPFSQITYQEAFLKYTGLDPKKVSVKELLDYMHQENIPYYEGIENEDVDAFLNLIISEKIEPFLGQNQLTALTHYPSTQAALAKTLPDGTAERFEVYYKGVELANGYHELCDPEEQEGRFHKSNEERARLGKKELPLDTEFLKALKSGMPQCAGVAVGFDRLMMLRHQANSLADVIPFTFLEA